MDDTVPQESLLFIAKRAETWMPLKVLKVMVLSGMMLLVESWVDTRGVEMISGGVSTQ